MSELAIVIPFFKIDFFNETLKSIANQSNRNFTVYIGNDDSDHDPKCLIEQKLGDLINFKYFEYKNNLGQNSLAKQWERCINEVKNAKWVIILGDDDVLGNSCVADFYFHLKKVEGNNINVIRFSSQVIDSNNHPISKVHIHPDIENSVDFLFKKINGNARSSLSEHIFKLSSISRIGFQNFPLAWHTDDLAILEFSEFGDIYTINSSAVSIRSSNISISGRKDFSKLKNKASFQFYHYLLNQKSYCFSEKEIKILFKKYEKTLLNDKTNITLFLGLLITYLKKYNIPGYYKFLRNFLKSISNAKRS